MKLIVEKNQTPQPEKVFFVIFIDFASKSLF